MKTISLPSGAELAIPPIPFSNALKLSQQLAKELKHAEIDLGTFNGETLAASSAGQLIK